MTSALGELVEAEWGDPVVAVLTGVEVSELRSRA